MVAPNPVSSAYLPRSSALPSPRGIANNPRHSQQRARARHSPFANGARGWCRWAASSRQHVTRPGSEKLLDWLDHQTDFFSAPASTRFHGACTGGLCMHSLNVYHALHDTFFTEGESEESFAI